MQVRLVITLKAAAGRGDEVAVLLQARAKEVPASRKLQADDAKALLKDASKLLAAKGKKLNEFDVTKSVSDDAVNAMLGPTGNLRAPTIRVGKTQDRDRTTGPGGPSSDAAGAADRRPRAHASIAL